MTCDRFFRLCSQFSSYSQSHLKRATLREVDRENKSEALFKSNEPIVHLLRERRLHGSQVGEI